MLSIRTVVLESNLIFSVLFDQQKCLKLVFAAGNYLFLHYQNVNFISITIMDFIFSENINLHSNR